MSLLEVSHLRKTFDESFVAVDDLSFHVDAGEIFGLVGPNGAGKTTTMTMLAGLLNPDSGSITLDGQPYDPTQHEQRVKFGIVPQNLAIYPDLTADENLRFFGGIYGLRGSQLTERVASTLGIIGLTDRAHSLVKTFSGGMKRRLNFGVALLHQPKLVILDEPTVGVDPQSRSHLLEAAQQLSRAGVSVLYASHYMEEIETICHRVAIVDHGRMLECGTLPELLSSVQPEMRLHIAHSSPALIAQLKQNYSVDHPVTEEIVVTLLMDRQATDASTKASLDDQLRDVMTIIQQHGARLISIESEEHNLERLFLKLTGNRLRD